MNTLSGITERTASATRTTKGAKEVDGLVDLAVQLLNKLRDGVKRIGDGRAEIDISTRTLDRISQKIRALPTNSPHRRPSEVIVTKLLRDLDGLSKQADIHQKNADAVFATIKKETGLGHLGGLAAIIAAVAAFLAGVAIWWKSLQNETKRINLKSAQLEARLNGFLPGNVVDDIDQQQQGGFNLGGLGGIAAVTLGIVLLAGADRIRSGGRAPGFGGGGFGSGGELR